MKYMQKIYWLNSSGEDTLKYATQEVWHNK